MTDRPNVDPSALGKYDHFWYTYLTTGDYEPGSNPHWYHAGKFRKWVRRLPTDPRCRLCYFPFEGVGGALSRLFFDIRPSRVNPYFCNHCEKAAEQYPGGAEVESTVLFADVRGSTSMAESMAPAEFTRLIKRFYSVAASVLFDTNAIVEKLVGDAVTGFYVPGFSGKDHAQVALNAARRILKETGCGDAEGQWIPVGIGVHTGLAYVGSVLSEGVANIAILGDTANTGARLASLAAAGEIYASQATVKAAGQDTSSLESRHLTVKGRTQPVDAWVLRLC